MPCAQPLSDADRTLLIEMFCCVIAADKKVSSREIQVVLDTLTTAGSTDSVESMKAVIVDRCKRIHQQGIDACLADLLQKAHTKANSPLADLFIRAQDKLLNIDGKCTCDEAKVSKGLVEALTGRGSDDAKTADAIQQGESPKATAIGTLLNVARTTASRAAAATERTKLTTVTLPAAFLALGKHCYASRRFASEFESIYQALDSLRAELDAAAQTQAVPPTAKSLTEKATEIANKGLAAAVSQQLKLKQQKLLYDLGKAVYQAKEASAGPKELCDSIRVAKERLKALNATNADSVDATAVDASQTGSKVSGLTAESSRRSIFGKLYDFVFSPIVVKAAAVVCAPVGLPLIWLHPSWHKGKKALWAAISIACFFGLYFIGEARIASTRKLVAAANESWDKGNKDEAATTYRKTFAALSMLPNEEQAFIYRRLIEYECRKDNKEKARQLLVTAEGQNLQIESEDPVVANFITTYRLEKEAKKQAEMQERERRKQAALAAKNEREAAATLQSTNTTAASSAEDKYYSVSKGLMQGKLKVVTGGDVGQNLRLSSLKWKSNVLELTVEWVDGSKPPWQYNYTVYDKKDEVLRTGSLTGGVGQGKSRGDKLRMKIFVGYEEAKDAVEIRIHY